FNMSQYISELSIVSRPAGGLTVRAPAAAAAVSPPTVAPPGPYMLFAITGDGVPSWAWIMGLQ
ncbi:MAG: galactose oxidase-like domain-containing protein, partial [Burkholderiales bacterium]